jgi:crotonobetaine/carnitine-CoA ligase
VISTGSDTVTSRLVQAAAAHPDRDFLVFEAAPDDIVTLTYSGMLSRARRSGARLRALGVARGSRVHIHLENCVEFYDAWFGCLLLGASIVPTNPLATVDELSYVIADAGCVLSITSEQLLASVKAARAVTGGPAIEAVTLAAAGVAEVMQEVLEPRDVAAVLYTSGTTSKPKGVMVTHANYLHVGEVVAGHLRLRPDDRWLIVLPLFHANAQYYCTMSALVTGASIALGPRFSASGWARQAVSMKATIASMFAAPIRMLLASPTQPDEAACRLRLTIFGQSLSTDQVKEFERRFGTTLVQLYGMTETVAPPTFNPVFGGCRPETIGRPLPHAQLRITNPDGVEVSTGETGELLVHGVPGETIMAGYLNQPEITAATIVDGWLHTGDVVSRDEDGYLTFIDRTKDMIKRSGENVAASEVEQVLNSHPAVLESAVIGIPDELRDEAIVAFVVLAEPAQVSEAELLGWATERLSRFKVPETIQVIDALPRTSVGKVRKVELRERLTS